MQRSEKPSTSVENENIFSKFFNRYPIKSIQRADIILQTSRSVIQLIQMKSLHNSPYKENLVQRLEHVDYGFRLEYVNWCWKNLELCPSFLHCIIFSDDCVFHGSWEANKHNVQILGTENSHATHNMSRNSEKRKFCVWYAVMES